MAAPRLRRPFRRETDRRGGALASTTAADPEAPLRCSFCGREHREPRARCSRCGTALGEAVEDLRREGERRRGEIRGRKAVADLFFLAGLLGGGPLLSFGVRPRLGLFLILAGGIASALRRYTEWSTAGTMLVGGLGAALVGGVFTDPPAASRTEPADVESRVAYVERLARGMIGEGIHVEARGPAGSVVWFYVPSASPSGCGDVPEPRVRRHLAELGVGRVVVAGRRGGEGVCTFEP